VLGDPDHGVYVALRTDKPPGNKPYLVYYSPAALATADPVPTAVLHGVLAAEEMVADPAGGIVFVTNDGDVDAWHPTGLVGRGSNGRDRSDHAGITSSTRRILPRGGFA
jgi:hypothetical protein